MHAAPARVVEYIFPAPTVYDVAPYISPALADYAASGPVVEYISPTPAVSYAAPVPVVEYTSPASAVITRQLLR